MPAKLRVFISSTMRDLQNERVAVVDRLHALGFEPVNAEGMMPTGKTTWEVLADEIDSCHLFILIVGEQYGWIPDAGPGAGEGRSATHMETLRARERGLPILPFFKRLDYQAPRDGEDAKRRDAFRDEVNDWNGGQFRGDFHLAKDLADRVCESVILLLSDSYRKKQIPSPSRSRNLEKVEMQWRSQGAADMSALAGVNFLPGEWVLFAGAGMSIAAGYPTAMAFAQGYTQALWPGASASEVFARHSLVEIAEYAESKVGAQGLRQIALNLMDMPQSVEPTLAHLSAVQKFRIIVTTNFDMLFERACEKLNLSYRVFTSSDHECGVDPDSVTIYKIDGTISAPETMILTMGQRSSVASNFYFWDAIARHLMEKPVAVVGHSIRDEASQGLLERRDKSRKGLYVAPNIDPVMDIILNRYKLSAVRVDADSFMKALRA